MSIMIERVKAPTNEVRLLVAELNDWLAARYAAEQRHGLALDQLFAPGIRFFLARSDGVVAGCGGVEIADGEAEVKRMYTRPEMQRRGVARAVLGHLEAEARSAGVAVLRLETGIHQPAAIALYESAGFLRRAAFGGYAAMPERSIATSLFMEKPL